MLVCNETGFFYCYPEVCFFCFFAEDSIGGADFTNFMKLSNPGGIKGFRAVGMLMPSSVW